MKVLVFFVLIFVFSGCNTLDNSVYPVTYIGSNNMTVDQVKSLVIEKSKSITAYSNETPSSICDQVGIYKNNSMKLNYSYSDCKNDANYWLLKRRNEIKKEEEIRRENQQKRIEKEFSDRREAEKIAKEKEESEKKEKERLEKENLSKELKSGSRKPKNAYEAAILYDAEDGSDLSKAPKIKPDKKMYHISGVIEVIESESSVIAKLFMWNTYFKVKIKESAKDAFIDNAKVNRLFTIVGVYSENDKIPLLNGRVVDIPSFDAIYFDSHKLQ